MMDSSKIKNWISKNYRERGLITKGENRTSLVQMIGFWLMVLGISYMGYFLLPDNSPSADGMAISFFIITLGTSFAFPELLKSKNDGLSTMRIVVLMIVNVICLLLIKIGWGHHISSLKDIGLDEYWMGVIAFVFGAKATQSYFESKLATPKETDGKGMAAVEFNGADLARLALAQNEQFLKAKFPNIASVSDAVHDLNHEETHVIAIYLKDEKADGIPEKLEVKMPDGKVKLINTEVIKGTGTGRLHYSQLDSISTQGSQMFGSMCCIVETEDKEIAVVTSGHVYSDGRSGIGNGWINPDQSKPVIVNEKQIGKWLFAQITQNQDLALVKLDHPKDETQVKKFAQKGSAKVSDQDIKNKKVTLISTVRGKREGYILDYNTSWEVPYEDKTVIKTGIILIGSDPVRENSKSVSEEGDSGGCVYLSGSEELLGIILGGNKKFTWVLPVSQTLDYWKLKLI